MHVYLMYPVCEHIQAQKCGKLLLAFWCRVAVLHSKEQLENYLQTQFLISHPPETIPSGCDVPANATQDKYSAVLQRSAGQSPVLSASHHAGG